MVKHVVMWRLKRQEDGSALKEALESMKGKVDTLGGLEVGMNYNPSEFRMDLVLITTHASREELERYQEDPLHCKVKEQVAKGTTQRWVVDFDC